ncbi:hypothetical protein [Roseivivax marinus]|uniref:hypothetical protein n=1 Tax=Roseivivax marinus TaxID=1379903 RepID=UPI00103DCB31|nr:hypothetical protein [Roseivivax marinus]
MANAKEIRPAFQAYNCFARVLLDLEANAKNSSLFARGCAQIFENHDFDDWAYPYIQVFEPNLFREVAYLNDRDVDRAERFEDTLTPAGRRLRELIAYPAELSDVWLSNTIGALISVAHFTTANELMIHLKARSLTGQGQFERAWLAFLITNRCNQGADAQVAFDEMRGAAETGNVPTGRVLDLCTQGVVWHLKSEQINEAQFRWCLTTGARLSKQLEHRAPETIASWYRGLAMLPAARNDPKRTRAYMAKAEYNAHAAIRADDNRGLSALNQLKTFHESSIKEFIYVDPDYRRALKSAQELVALDPYWPLSLAEKGEVHERFGEHEAAAECFERAAALGPPYVGLHLRKAATSRLRIGDRDRALQHANTLGSIAPDSETLGEIEKVLRMHDAELRN